MSHREQNLRWGIDRSLHPRATIIGFAPRPNMPVVASPRVRQLSLANRALNRPTRSRFTFLPRLADGFHDGRSCEHHVPNFILVVLDLSVCLCLGVGLAFVAMATFQKAWDNEPPADCAWIHQLDGFVPDADLAFIVHQAVEVATLAENLFFKAFHFGSSTRVHTPSNTE